MGRFLRLFCIVCAMLPTVYPQTYWYNCNREDMACSSPASADATCGSSGACSCVNTYVRINDYSPCAPVSALDQNGACTTDKCENGGTCLLMADSTTEICYCADGYYGETCSMGRAMVDCSDLSNVVIMVKPYTDANDWVYLLTDPLDSANCQFNGPDGNGVHTKTVDTTAATPACGVTSTTSSGTTTITGQFAIAHTSPGDMLLETDFKATFTCQYGASVPNTFSLSAPGDLSGVPDLDTTIPVATATPITMALEVNNAPLTASAQVNIGTEIVIKHFLPASVGKDFRLADCILDNGEEVGTANYQKLDLSDAAGCPVYKSSVVEKGHTRLDSTNYGGVTGILISSPFMVPVFTKGSGVAQVTCNYALCDTVGDAACTTVDCSGVAAANSLLGAGRRKREANEERTITTSFRVQVPGAPSESSASVGNSGSVTTVVEEKDCLQDTRTLSIIVVLAVFVIVLLIACVIVAYCAAQRIRRRKEDYCYDNSSSSTHNLSIPRPGYKP